MLATREYERALRPLLGQAAGYAHALLRDRHEAEDAVQQAALRGWEGIASFDPTRSFKAWWFSILRNCCFDIQRKAKAARSQSLGDYDAPAPAQPDAPDWAVLDAAIEKISSAHQEILRLKYYGDLRYDELAQTLGIPIGTVMSRLHLARKALAAHLREEEL